MSIQVDSVRKEFSGQVALDDINLNVPSGQVVGLLGPNGAGKSTLMKLICGYLPANAGSIKVCTYDVDTEPLQTKARIGYLPEHNPLPDEMYIREYLRYVGGLYNLPNPSARAEEVIKLVGLTPEVNKKISQLSKGYRQRVGLAAAIIHKPEVLILDEPTSGLDPNQLVEIRALIKSIGSSRTVMLSTHIMQEVEAMCGRVVLVKKGRIVADDSISSFTSRPDGLEGAFKALTS